MNGKKFVFWIVVAVAAFLLWQVVKASPSPNQQPPEISYSAFLSQVEAGNVTSVAISGSQIAVTARDGGSLRVTGPTSQEGMLQMLRQNHVEIWFKEHTGSTQSTLLNLAPLALLAALWYFMIRQMRRNKAGDSMSRSVG